MRELRQELSLDGGETASLSGEGSPCASLPAIAVPTTDYETILRQHQLDEWLARISAAPLVSLDTETTGLDPMKAQLVGIALSIEPRCSAYLPLAHRYAGVPEQLPIDSVLEQLKPWLQDPAKFKVGQNLKYDKHVFANHGIELNGIAHDTLIQSYVLESHRPHDMDNLALRHLDAKTIKYDEVTGKGAARIDFDQVDIEHAINRPGRFIVPIAQFRKRMESAV